MIKTAISYRNMEGDDKLREYATTKIGELEKYLPRQIRESASARIVRCLVAQSSEWTALLALARYQWIQANARLELARATNVVSNNEHRAATIEEEEDR